MSNPRGEGLAPRTLEGSLVTAIELYRNRRPGTDYADVKEEFRMGLDSATNQQVADMYIDPNRIAYSFAGINPETPGKYTNVVIAEAVGLIRNVLWPVLNEVAESRGIEPSVRVLQPKPQV
jgi:hypothetical protein